MIITEYKQRLDEIFELNRDTMIIPDEEMSRMVKAGEASTSLNIPNAMVENSGIMRQVGPYVYVKYENPNIEGENKIQWVVHNAKTHINGKAYQT